MADGTLFGSGDDCEYHGPPANPFNGLPIAAFTFGFPNMAVTMAVSLILYYGLLFAFALL
jgi:hypothetical protein